MRRFFLNIALCLVAILSVSHALAADARARLTRDLDRLVAIDSQSWVFNRYDIGSMSDVRILGRSDGGRTITLYGDYTYNGGANGWVKAQISDGTLDCLEFWDFNGICRPLGRSPSQTIAAGALTAVVVGIVGATSSSSGNEDRGDPCHDYPTGDQDHPWAYHC